MGWKKKDSTLKIEPYPNSSQLPFAPLFAVEMTPSTFRSLLSTLDEGDIVRTYIVTSDPGPHVHESDLRHLEKVISEKFQLTQDQRVSAIVVGSAKLGFSFIEKRENGIVTKPAYRNYQPGRSDIDIAIISPAVYGKIWSNLASIGARSKTFPDRSRLGQYMYHGWLRPDKFPNPKPQRCLDWDDAYRALQDYKPLRNKKLRLALYHSQHFLETYQQRGIRTAREQEQMP